MIEDESPVPTKGDKFDSVPNVNATRYNRPEQHEEQIYRCIAVKESE